MVVLQMIQDLMIKGKDEFLEHFARLGVFSKVAALAGPQETTPEPEAESNQAGEEQRMEDARELLVGRAYHWRDWCICRGRDCLYIWSDAAALELSNGSNGWFRFILDGKLATMYSSGSPEGGTDTGEYGPCMHTRFYTCKNRRLCTSYSFNYSFRYYYPRWEYHSYPLLPRVSNTRTAHVLLSQLYVISFSLSLSLVCD